MPRVSIHDIDVIAPNFKQRLSGVTSTIIQLVPKQQQAGVKIATIGPGLPDTLPRLSWLSLVGLWGNGPNGRPRVWHARRNVEMLAGLVMRHILRMKLRLVFTSASQRHHTGWTKFLISKMDAVISTSAKTAAYLERPSTVSLHGIDTDRFSPPDDKAEAKRVLGLDPSQNYAGCFGRVRRQKGTDVFVDAMIRLLPDHPNWSAIVAGRATAKHVDFENGLKEKVRVAGLEKRILFVGEHTNINEWYRALDLFIAPQRWEGFGLTPLEAMATGVPVVATDVGAFSELVVEGKTGTIIKAGDTDAMAQASRPYMDDGALRLSAGQNAREHAARNFTIAGEVAKLSSVYFPG